MKYLIRYAWILLCTTSFAQDLVTWSTLVGVTYNEDLDLLEKTEPVGGLYNNGARSADWLVAGGTGTLSYTHNYWQSAFQLGYCPVDEAYDAIVTYGYQVSAGGWLYILYNQQNMGIFTTIKLGDELAIEISSGRVKYLLNGMPLYENDVTSQPYQVLAHLRNDFHEIGGVKTTFASPTVWFNLPADGAYEAVATVNGEDFALPTGTTYPLMMGETPTSDKPITVGWNQSGSPTGHHYDFTRSVTGSVTFDHVNVSSTDFAPDLNQSQWVSTADRMDVFPKLGDFISHFNTFTTCPTEASYNVNYVQEVLLDDAGAVWQETKHYSDALGRGVYSLAHTFNDQNFVANATGFDQFGRPAAQSLPAPTYDSAGCYTDLFFRNSTNVRYGHGDFDSGTGGSYTSSSNPVGGSTVQGTVGWYYSNQNTDEAYVPASGYPFQTSEFFLDPMGRPKQGAGVGESHKLGSGHESRSFYLKQAGELAYLYGLNRHYIAGKSGAIHAHKTVSIDADGDEYVTYLNEFGEAIATCRSGLTNSCLNQQVTRYIGGERPMPVDIHLHASVKQTLELDYYPLKFSYSSQEVVSYTLMDLATNYVLQAGTDFTLDSTTREVTFIGPTYGSSWTAGSHFFRIGLRYDSTFLDNLKSYFSGNSPDATVFKDQAIRYELNYSHWAINYLDERGRVVKSLSPESIDCATYDPANQQQNDVWTYYESCYNPVTANFSDNTTMQYTYSTAAVGTTHVRSLHVQAEMTPSFLQDNITLTLTSLSGTQELSLCEFMTYFQAHDLYTDGSDSTFTAAPIHPGQGVVNGTIEPGSFTYSPVRAQAAATGDKLVLRAMEDAALSDSSFAALYTKGGSPDPLPGLTPMPTHICETCDIPRGPFVDGQGNTTIVDLGFCTYTSGRQDGYPSLTYNQAVTQGTSFCQQYGYRFGSAELRIDNVGAGIWCVTCAEKEECLEDAGVFVAQFKVPVKLYKREGSNPRVFVEELEVHATLRAKECFTTDQSCNLFWSDITTDHTSWLPGTVRELTPTGNYTIEYDFGDLQLRTLPGQNYRSINATQPPDQFFKLLGVRLNVLHESVPVNDTVIHAPYSMASTYTYDPIGNLVADETPDEGKRDFVQDQRFRTVFSRTAAQAAENTFSYVLYDASNRAVETGEFHEQDPANTANYRFQPYGADPASLNPGETSVLTVVNTPEVLPAGARYERKFLVYDTQTGLPTGFPVAFTSPYDEGQVVQIRNDQEEAYFGYDLYGRLAWQVNYYPDVQTFRTFRYTYDMLGNVLQVSYQENVAGEAFYYHFAYDANKRLRQVHTSLDGVTQALQAEYLYYAHGPLKRVELADGFQGLDYVYTLQGWLKSINSPELADRDPGKDGLTGTTTPADVFGLALDYFDGDYLRQDTWLQTYSNEVADGNGLQNSYTGLVKAQRWQTNSDRLSSGSSGLQHTGTQLMYGYTYDAFDRVTGALFNEVTAAGTRNNASGSTTGSPLIAATDNYKVWNLDYDRNGNLGHLNRNAHGATAADRSMDAFTYQYEPGTNRLNHLNDAGTGTWTGDLEDGGTYDPQNSTTWNFAYDASGRMTQHASEGQYITYTPEGLVEDVFADSAHTQLKTKFYYNASGQRVRKAWYQYNSGTGTNELLRETRYYRASGGMPYEVETTEYSGGSPTGTDNEYVVYGAGRLGTYQRDQNAWNYELADHLGNARAVFTPERVTQFATGFEGTGTHDHLYQGGIVSTDEQRTGTNSVVVNGTNGPRVTFPVENGDQLNAQIYYVLSASNSIPHMRLRLYTESGDLIHTQTQAGNSSPISTWQALTLTYTVSVGGDPVQAEVDIYTTTSGGTPQPVHLDDWTIDITTTGNSGIKDVSLISLADYYPFGEVMPGRSANNTAYRYTFQGQERDAELNWTGFELRTFDGRLGRWNNRDPYRQHWSPFVAMGNNPISRIDPDGGLDYYIDGLLVSSTAMYGFMKSGATFDMDTYGDIPFDDNISLRDVSYQDGKFRVAGAQKQARFAGYNASGTRGVYENPWTGGYFEDRFGASISVHLTLTESEFASSFFSEGMSSIHATSEGDYNSDRMMFGRYSMNSVNIEFGPNANAAVVSEYSRSLLRDAGAASGNNLIHITSTARDASAQARAMFSNLERNLAEQRSIYRAPGQAVIDVYVAQKAAGASANQIKAAMTDKINELGPSSVSRHSADPSVLNVMDISVRRLTNPSSFRRAISAYPTVRLLNENGVFHVEIPQHQNR